MRILYIFPHPDDESFGPAAVISMQRRAGHEVHLLTLTRGGATKVRHQFGYSVEQMGYVRYQEMLDMEKALDLNGMTVLDLPDSGLKELDPRDIESILTEHIERLRPDIIVTYPVHGISGFHDHLIMHATAKRAYLEMKSSGASYLKRLAFYTLSQESAGRASSKFNLNYSTEAEIDCVIHADDIAIAAMRQALDCYATYTEVIQASGVMEIAKEVHYFEFFQEDCSPPVNDICMEL